MRLLALLAALLAFAIAPAAWAGSVNETNQGLRQDSVRAVTGTALDYNGDWMALFDQASIPAGDFNGRLLQWINKKLSTSYVDIDSAMQAFAVNQGAPDWDSLGTFNAATNINPTGDSGTPSAFFGYTQNLFQATSAQSNYLTTPTAAFSVPTVAANSYGTCTTASHICSWTIVSKFQMPATSWPAPNNASTTVLALGGNTGGGCNTTATDKCIYLTTPGTSTTAGRNNELSLFYGSSGTITNPFWNPPAACGPAGGYACTGKQTGLDMTGGTNYCLVLSQYGVDSGAIGGSAAEGIVSLSLTDATGTPVGGSPIVTSTSNAQSALVGLYWNAGTLRLQSAIGSLMANIGVQSTTTTNPNGTPGAIADMAMIYGVFPNAAGTPNSTLISDYCNGNKTFSQWWTEYTSTASSGSFGTELLNAWYPLNPVAGVTLAGTSPTPTVTTALTAAGGATFLAAAPITHGSAVVLNNYGAVDVQRIEPGSGAVGATGSIYFSGTYNTTALGGTPSGFQGEVLQGGSPVVNWTGLSGLTFANGTFTGYISGLGANYLTTSGGNTANATPYTICVRASNATAYSYCSQTQIYLGVPIWIIGQSESNQLFGTNPSTSTGNSANTVKINTGAIVVANSVASGPQDPNSTPLAFTNNCRSGYAGCPNGPLTANRQVITSATGPENQPGTGAFGGTCTSQCPYEAIGDGAATIANEVAAASNLPVSIIDLAHSGNPVDAWIAGGQSVTGVALTDTTGTLTLPTITMTNLTNPATGTSGPTGGQPWVSGFFYSILPGSVKIKDTNGCVVAQDTGQTGGTNGVGTFNLVDGGCASGPGAVTAGGMNYAPATKTNAPSLSASITFASGDGTHPACPCTMSYTTVVDAQAGAYDRQQTASGGLFTGLDLWGQGNAPGTGQMTSILNAQSGPPALIHVEQVNANLSSSFTANPPPANNSSGSLHLFEQEWDYVFSTLMPEYWWWPSNTGKNAATIVTGSYPRDTAPDYNQAGTADQFFQNWGTTAGHIYGGTIRDDTVQQPTLGGQSPHGDASPFGTIRYGRRLGVNLWQAYLGNQPPEPTITSAAWTTSTTYEAGCSTSPGCIRITFTLAAAAIAAGADRLNTCGTNLSGGTSPATGVCTFTDYTTAPVVHGFVFGTTTTQFYDDRSNDPNSVSTTLPNTDGQAITCKLVDKLIVECLPTTAANWSGYPTTTYIKYNPEFALTGSLASASLASYTGWAGSSPFTEPTTGGTCTTQPTVVVTQTSGTLAIAGRATRGQCTVAPTGVTVTHFTGGATGTPTITMNTSLGDINDMGSYLYDNAGGFGSSAAAGGSEPGNPVHSLNIPYGPF